MAYSVLAFLALFSLIANLCHSFNPKLLNNDQYGSSTTDATWYGEPYGFGSSGGSCGYQAAVETTPFSSMITAVSPSLYNEGHACGTCYQVKCTTEHCSGKGVTVVVTDSCPGCESTGNHKFDLSGTSFGAMAISGQDSQLRDLGIVEIEYQMVPCNFVGTDVAFHTDSGSNPSYFATNIEYENGGLISKVEIKQTNSTEWIEMEISWGAVYKKDFGMVYAAPYSIKITEANSKSIVADNVIPANYKPGDSYRSLVNF